MKIKSTIISCYHYTISAGALNRFLASLGTLLIYIMAATGAAADEQKSAFFEKYIRPVLVEHCYGCHSVAARSVKGGLLLDTKTGLAAGGGTGPVIKPGDPDNSTLFLALKYEGEVADMPPKGKLPQETIARFRQWIADGAFDPRSSAAANPSPKPADTWAATFASRADWWSFKPLADPQIPQNGEKHPIDAFLLQKMREKGLGFAPPADKVTVLRRLSFDLTGLPPTEAEIRAFLADNSENAYENQVDRLLASPHYGERVARRWMDLTHYSETVGSEQDALIPHSWAYRDYLIRSFNSDIAYAQLVREHIAGDLVPSPRRDPATGWLESPAGTAWLRFVEFYHSPVDVKNEEAVVIENQIDTLGKTFLGLTVACARCHDHKFDPIGTDDYYRLYGMLRTARASVHALNDPEKAKVFVRDTAALKQKVADLALSQWRNDFGPLKSRIEMAFQSPEKADAALAGWLKTQGENPRRTGHAFARALEALKLNQDVASTWKTAWKQVAEQGQATWARPGSRQKIVADFTQAGQFPAGWRARAFFTPNFTGAGSFRLGSKPEIAFDAIRPSGFYSDAISEKLGATLRSPEMKLSGGTYSVMASGSAGARLRLVVDNFQGVDILFGGVTPVLNQPRPTWFKLGVREIWKGQEGYIELATRDDIASAGVVRDLNQFPRDGRSSAGIRYVVFHENAAEAVAEASPAFGLMQRMGELTSANPAPAQIAQWLTDEIQSTLVNYERNSLMDYQAALLQDLLEAKLLNNNLTPDSDLGRTVAELKSVEEKIDFSARSIGVAESAPSSLKQAVFLRGDHKKPGPEALPGDLKLNNGWKKPVPATDIAPRLALAESWASGSNPLVQRVMANRIWGWYFGRGIFSTVDNLGHMGEPPTHPELLEWLAGEFLRKGGSIRIFSRMIVTSRAYRQSSLTTEMANEIDPGNLLLSHASVRRLDAESLRDAMLTASGRLDRSLYGLPLPTPQPPGLTDDKKPVSGPVDGFGRRSIYLNVRKNFPIEFMEIFDRPRPTLTMGRRNVSNQPSQALAMLNDPLVRSESQRLGQLMQNEMQSTLESKITSVYFRLFGRLPMADEINHATAFINANQGKWSELVAALMGTREFLFIR